MLNVTKCVVNEIYLKLFTFFPLIICKEVFNSLYKLIDCENIEETEKARCDIPQNYFVVISSIFYYLEIYQIFQMLFQKIVTKNHHFLNSLVFNMKKDLTALWMLKLYLISIGYKTLSLVKQRKN